MCIALPVKVIDIKKGSEPKEKIFVKEINCKKQVKGSLVQVKVGDYVILQNDFIVRKVSKKKARKFFNLIKNTK